MRTLLAGALLVALVAAPMRGRAQGVGGQINASAEVIGLGMAITTLRDLNFGQVPKGVATTVQPTGANAGEWQVQGNKNADVRITFTLPTLLTNIQALPGSTMPISFNTTAALWRRSTNDPVGATPFDPAVGINGKFGPNPNPVLYIWIGGTVNPAAAAKPGIYTGTIIVSLVYL